jgi:hypothetical protein
MEEVQAIGFLKYLGDDAGRVARSRSFVLSQRTTPQKAASTMLAARCK